MDTRPEAEQQPENETPPTTPTPEQPEVAEPAEPGAPVEAAPLAPQSATEDATVSEAETASTAIPEAAAEDAPEASAAPEPSEAPAQAAPADGADDGTGETPAEDATEDGTDSETPKADAPDGTPSKPKAKKAKKKKKKKVRRQPQRAPEPPLPPELKAEAAAAARAAILQMGRGKHKATEAALDMMGSGLSLAYIGRFQREKTFGLDERRLRGMRDAYQDRVMLEERRVAIKAILETRGALDEDTAKHLQVAESPGEMEDLAAPYLPVVASRATMARGAGLQPLADAIRSATETTPLSESAKPLLPEGAEGPQIDQALAAARDIVAEEICLIPELRAALRQVFRREGRVSVALRSERKGDAGRHASLVGLDALASKIPALKILAIRRGEKDRVLVSTIEPPEQTALSVVHHFAAKEDHPHAGFLRAAAEDGYRRILKPVLQNELRGFLKRRADDEALETFERNLRNLLLGPYAGRRRVLGLRPDVTGGHRWCAVDTEGLPVGAGQLPHEPTAGREACLAELAEKLKTYECTAIAVGRTGGRAEAISLSREVAKGLDADFEVIEVADGGTRVLETMGKLEFDDRPEVPAENRGALSLARRFQDPLGELVSIDPKALALGPHVHDVHQGRLRTMMHDVLESCAAHVGPDPARASADLLACVPGFTRSAAKAFVKWRNAGGNLQQKAQLAAVDGVGTAVAEQAVGFLRIPGAADPRDRTQLHVSQYGLIEKMAASVDTDIAGLFGDPRLRSQVPVDQLAVTEIDTHALHYALYQATAGADDPRPVLTNPIAPPSTITMETLTPGLMLQGRVTRAARFGVFVDVGLGVDALIPSQHIGARPGLDQAEVAPVGAVINAGVLDVDTKKRKLTLTMRPERRGPIRAGLPRPPRSGGGRGPARGGQRGPRSAERGAGQPGRAGGAGRGAGAGAGRGAGAGAGRGAGAGAGRGAGAGSGGAGRGGDGRGGSRGGDGRGAQRGAGRGKGRPQRGGGGGRGLFDKKGGRDRHSGGPRTISLKADAGAPDEAQVVDESKLTPEELMQRKIDAMKRKLQGG